MKTKRTLKCIKLCYERAIVKYTYLILFNHNFFISKISELQAHNVSLSECKAMGACRMTILFKY